MTAASALTDTFATKDLALWTWSGTAGVSSGRLVLIPTTGYTDQIESIATYNLVSSSLTVELVTAPQGNGGIDTYFTAFTGGDEARFVIEAGDMIMREIAGASNTATTITYDPVAHRWLRLRHDASTIYWETSPDNVTWTTRRSKSPGRTWDTIQVRMLTGFFGSEPTPGQTLFDNLNVSTPAVADTAAAADATTVAATVAVSDTAAAADTVTVAAAAALPDTAAAADAATVTAALTLADTASAADAAAVAATLALTDAAAAADSLTVLAALALTDAASALDLAGLAVAATLTDTGSASDALVGANLSNVTVLLTETATAFDRIHGNVLRPAAGTVTRPNTGITYWP